MYLQPLKGEALKLKPQWKKKENHKLALLTFDLGEPRATQISS